MERKILTGSDVINLMLSNSKAIEADSSFEMYVSLMPAIPPGAEKVFKDIFGAKESKSGYESFMSDLGMNEDYTGKRRIQINDIEGSLYTLENIRTKRMDIAYIGYSTKQMKVDIMFYRDGAKIRLDTSLMNEIDEKDSADISSKASEADEDVSAVIKPRYEKFDSTGLTFLTDPIFEAIKSAYTNTEIL